VSKDQIIALKDEKIATLKHRIVVLEKLIFNAKTERFIPSTEDPEQLNLFGGLESSLDDPSQSKEIITYERKKKTRLHPGRHPLPEHLPVKEFVIEPECDTEGMVKIGEEITETLDYTPASLVKIKTIRPKYIRPNEGGILIAELPSRALPKSIAESSLLSHIMVKKFVDHMPFYRQIQGFKRDYDWQLSDSTLNDWFAACCTLLDPLYNRMKEKILTSGYIQVDESPIKVQDSEKKGKTHQGYQWVYHSPEQKLIIFHYRKGRGMQGPKEFLNNYNGWLQSDGYRVYDKINKSNPQIHLAGCLAHVRRYYTEALDSDRKRSETVLVIIKKIYMHERECTDYTAKQRKAYRIKHMKPLLETLKTWIDKESLIVIPKSPIGKAMRYTLNQWDKIMIILINGKIELDNNLIENKIRPLALGRKNYLFAGSHKAAQRIAMMYSFFATCKATDTNPYKWLKNTLDKIGDTKLSQLDELIPRKDIL
jgi:transposase